MDAPLRVYTSVDTSDMPAGRHELQAIAVRILDLRGLIKDLYPREVEGDKIGILWKDVAGIRRIKQGRVKIAASFDHLRTVEDREAILSPLSAVGVNRAPHATVSNARRRDKRDL